MVFGQFGSMLHAQSRESRSRTDAMRFIWIMILTLCSATLGLALGNAAQWLVVAAASLTGCIISAAAVAFFIVLAKKPDLLRSENFVLEKMAIEEGIYGDSSSGVIEVDPENGKAPIKAALPRGRKRIVEG